MKLLAEYLVHIRIWGRVLKSICSTYSLAELHIDKMEDKNKEIYEEINENKKWNENENKMEACWSAFYSPLSPVLATIHDFC